MQYPAQRFFSPLPSECIMEQSSSDELLFLLSILLIPLCLPQFAATCSLPDMCHGQLGVWVAICVCVTRTHNCHMQLVRYSSTQSTLGTGLGCTAANPYLHFPTLFLPLQMTNLCVQVNPSAILSRNWTQSSVDNICMYVCVCQQTHSIDKEST